MEYVTYEQTINPDGSVEIHAPTDKNSRLIHHCKAELIGGRWLSSLHSIENTGTDEAKTGLKIAVRLNTWFGALKFARDGRIISGMQIEDSYPAHGELPRKRSELDEGWFSIENQYGVWGIAFGKDVVKMGKHWAGHYFEYNFDSIPPGEKVHIQPVFVYAGPGDHNVIRSGWWRLCEGKSEKPPEIDVHKLRRLFTVPEITVVDNETECEVCFDNLRLVPAKGEILISADNDIEINKTKLEFKDTIRDNPYREKLQVKTLDDSVGASSIHMRLNSEAGSAECESLVIKVDSSRKVSVIQEGDEYVVANNIASFRIDPGFGGGIHSFTASGREWLRSPYPDKKALFCWYNPFRGGIRPVLRTENEWLDHMYKEKWDIDEFSETVGGINFKGVEVNTVIEKNENLKGIRVRARYLLSEGHRILRFVYVAENLFDVAYRNKGGFEVFQDVHPENKTRQKFDYGLDTERKSGTFAAYHPSSGWLITENDESHECLLVLACNINNELDHLWVGDHSIEYGQHAISDIWLNLKGNEIMQSEYYLVQCADPDEAMKLRGLLKLK